MSTFIVNTNVMAKVVTAILLNFDTFDGQGTCRTALLAEPTNAQKPAGSQIGRKIFLMNRRVLRARYGCGEHLNVPEFVFGKWADTRRWYRPLFARRLVKPAMRCGTCLRRRTCRS